MTYVIAYGTWVLRHHAGHWRRICGVIPWPAHALTGGDAAGLGVVPECPRFLAGPDAAPEAPGRSEEHTSELQSLTNLVCRLLLEKKKHNTTPRPHTTDVNTIIRPVL